MSHEVFDYVGQQLSNQVVRRTTVPLSVVITTVQEPGMRIREVRKGNGYGNARKGRPAGRPMFMMNC